MGSNEGSERFSWKTSAPHRSIEFLSYAGFVLVSYELVKGMIVRPIQLFYKNTNFGEQMPFKSYEKDVLSRSKNEFEAMPSIFEGFYGSD